MEDEVLDKYKVEDSKGEAFQWRWVRRSKKDKTRKW